MRNIEFESALDPSHHSGIEERYAQEGRPTSIETSEGRRIAIEWLVLDLLPVLSNGRTNTLVELLASDLLESLLDYVADVIPGKGLSLSDIRSMTLDWLNTQQNNMTPGAWDLYQELQIEMQETAATSSDESAPEQEKEGNAGGMISRDFSEKERLRVLSRAVDLDNFTQVKVRKQTLADLATRLGLEVEKDDTTENLVSKIESGLMQSQRLRRQFNKPLVASIGDEEKNYGTLSSYLLDAVNRIANGRNQMFSLEGDVRAIQNDEKYFIGDGVGFGSALIDEFYRLGSELRKHISQANVHEFLEAAVHDSLHDNVSEEEQLAIHRAIYLQIQTILYGDDEVAEFGRAVRSYITRSLQNRDISQSLLPTTALGAKNKNTLVTNQTTQDDFAYQPGTDESSVFSHTGTESLVLLIVNKAAYEFVVLLIPQSVQEFILNQLFPNEDYALYPLAMQEFMRTQGQLYGLKLNSRTSGSYPALYSSPHFDFFQRAIVIGAGALPILSGLKPGQLFVFVPYKNAIDISIVLETDDSVMFVSRIHHIVRLGLTPMTTLQSLKITSIAAMAMVGEAGPTRPNPGDKPTPLFDRIFYSVMSAVGEKIRAPSDRIIQMWKKTTKIETNTATIIDFKTEFKNGQITVSPRDWEEVITKIVKSEPENSTIVFSVNIDKRIIPNDSERQRILDIASQNLSSSLNRRVVVKENTKHALGYVRENRNRFGVFVKLWRVGEETVTMESVVIGPNGEIRYSGGLVEEFEQMMVELGYDKEPESGIIEFIIPREAWRSEKLELEIEAEVILASSA